MNFPFRTVAAIMIFCPALYTSAHAQSAAQFYKGKSLALIVGFDAGGGYDVYARLLARYLPHHLAGITGVVTQNMPGAGGLSATNYLYKVAPKDGSVLAATHSNVALAQLLGGRNVEYDARQFNWVGRMTSAIDVHYSWHTSTIKNFSDIKIHEAIAAGTGPTSNSVIFPRLLNELLGTRFKLITGYKGTSEGNLALERREVDLVLKPWEGVKSGNADWLADRKINLIVQYSVNRHPDLLELPTVVDVMETEEQRRLIRIFASTSDIGRSLAMPPGVPAERVDEVRKAFVATMKDSRFLVEAESMKVEIDPMDGVRLHDLIASTFDISSEMKINATRIYEQIGK